MAGAAQQVCGVGGRTQGSDWGYLGFLGSFLMEGQGTPGQLFLGGYKGIQMLSPPKLFNQPSVSEVTIL